MIIKHQSRVKSQSGEGRTTTIVYQGTHAEMLELQAAHLINEAEEEGRLRNSRVYQESPLIWCCELQYESDNQGESSRAPETAYGKKSAQLKGSMLSMPLENHKDYRTCWNHYLAAAPGITSVPSWWGSAKKAELGDSDAQNYRWVKSPGECPGDKKGMWRTIKAPTLPGVESYDMATYSITESARFRTARAAGKMVAGKLNQIGKPEEDFGLTPSGYNWKCDDASVSWNGKHWLATMTWTRSGDDQGWNTKLYQ